MKEEKIIQIIPADGWKAVFQEDGSEIKDDVVCFALVEVNEEVENFKKVNYQEVRAMMWGEFKIEFCDESSDFTGLEKISDAQD